MSTRSNHSHNRDSGSIFDSGESAWNHLFADLDKPSSSGTTQHGSAQPRRQTMTESEKKIIRELLDEVFQAKEKQSAEDVEKARALMAKTEAVVDPILPGSRRIRRRKGKTSFDVVMDEKQEAIARCQTKEELLRWAQTHVFKEFEDAQRSLSEDSRLSVRVYSNIVPRLMRAFRDQFGDPYLALFVYKYTRNHSLASFVHGCSTRTYEELLQTLWESFLDLQGIQSTLEEMKINGVAPNRRIEKLVEKVCHEAADNKLWLDRSEGGDEVAMVTLTRISDLLVEVLSATEKKPFGEGKDWKAGMVTEKDGDDFVFDNWEDPPAHRKRR